MAACASTRRSRSWAAMPPGPGYWSAVTYRRRAGGEPDQQTFSSRGRHRQRPGPGVPADRVDHRHGRPEAHEAPPPGARRRSPPGPWPSWRSRSGTGARRLIDAARETGGSCDFVEAFAAPLPLQVICDMLGIPEEDEEQVFHWTNVLLGVGDPEFVTEIDELKSSARAFMEYAGRLGVERAEHPGDDLSSLLMQAEVDGERLTPVRVRRLRRPAGHRRQRDHPQRHLLGHEAPHRPSRPAGPPPGQLRRAHRRRHRRDRALGLPRAAHAPKGAGRRRGGRHQDLEGREGGDVVLVGQP